MQLKRFTNPQLFYDHTAPFLLDHEAENNLILGITGEINSGRYENSYMACVEDETGIRLVALRTPSNNVLLSTTDVVPTGVLPLLVTDLRATYNTIPGVNGPKGLAAAFARSWGQPHHLKMAQCIYKLTEVIAVNGVAGDLRRATAADHDLIVHWLNSFDRDVLGKLTDQAESDKRAQHFYNSDPTQRGLYLWLVDGAPVSMAGYAGPTPNGIRVLAVYTPPEQRKRGYASASVAALSQQLLDEDRQFCFLYTDLGNPTSNHIYQTIGYKPVLDVDMFAFE
jgi:uncharacterized protein